MDGININDYYFWKRDFVRMLFAIVVKVLFFWKFSSDIEIPGFMNIRHREEIRMERRCARQDLAEEWGDTPESRQDNEVNGYRYLDIFCLRRLFEMQELFDEMCELDWARFERERPEREEEERRVIARLDEQAELREHELRVLARAMPHPWTAPGA